MGAVLAHDPALFVVESQGVQADTEPVNGAGLGYLAGGLATALAWVWWLRHGRPLADAFARDIAARARSASPGLRWTYGPWRSERWQAEASNGRAGFGMWLPITLFLPVFVVVFITAAISALAR